MTAQWSTLGALINMNVKYLWRCICKYKNVKLRTNIFVILITFNGEWDLLSLIFDFAITSLVALRDEVLLLKWSCRFSRSNKSFCLFSWMYEYSNPYKMTMRFMCSSVGSPHPSNFYIFAPTHLCILESKRSLIQIRAAQKWALLFLYNQQLS